MSWSKLDDLWTEQMEQTMPDDFADRWHYLAMIQRCSRVEARDGIIPTTMAERCSDHPDPKGAIVRLSHLGLVVDLGKTIKLVRADQHVISEAKKEELERNREYKKRSRAHATGDHQHCIPGDSDKPANCQYAPHGKSDSQSDINTTDVSNGKGKKEGHSSSIPDSHLTVTDDVGTGRDGQGQVDDTRGSSEEVDLQTGEISSTSPTPASAESYESIWGEPHPMQRPASYDLNAGQDSPIPAFVNRSK